MSGLRLLLAGVLVLAARGAAPAAPSTEQASVVQVPSAGELAAIQREVETLRGKKFLHDVPARTISETELRALVEHEIAKDYPGRQLTDLEDLMAWLDIVPPHTDLKKAMSDFLVDEMAGMYDSDSKTMCIPSFPNTNQPAGKLRKKPSEKKLEEMQGPEMGIVFAHEFTHALEDQYWPMDNPDEEKRQTSDQEDAQSFLYEGSATRLMVEALPCEFEHGRPGSYILTWNLLHSGLGETVLKELMGHVWKSPEVKAAGVPEALARGDTMSYSFGYVFCARILRDWGLDGLDYIYDHPPVSAAQVMHPKKCWDWRDFPVEVTLPETLAGGWTRLIDDSLGEAGIAALLGCSLTNLNRGEHVADGWDGDRVALYQGADGRRMLGWALAWDTPKEARRFARAWVEERRVVHGAMLTRKAGQICAWTCPGGRVGALHWEGRRVVLFETDQAAALDHRGAWEQSVTFVEPPEAAERGAVNRGWLRFNPVMSWRKDGDYAVTRAFGGLLWRHDHNSVGSADRALLGIVGERRRTTSLNKWRLGWGLLIKHESEARREMTKTTVLPWGVFCSHFAAALPYAPGHTLTRTTLLWGLAASRQTDAQDRHIFTVLPAGLLFRSTTGSGEVAVHVLGTGATRRETELGGITTRFRLFGIPVWTARSAP